MPPHRLIRARSLQVAAGVAVVVIAIGCSGIGSPAQTGAAATTPLPPSPESPPPMRAFPVDNAPINIAARDGEIWAVGDGVLLRIDGATNATTEFPLDIGAGSGSIGASTDALWIADWLGDVVLRVDPANGAIVATIPVAAPVGVIATAEGIFVGSEGAAGVVRIDPDRNVVAMEYPQRGGFAYADGSLWFAQRDAGTVVRVQAATGQVQSRFEVPAEGRPGPDAGLGGCFVGGRSPDAWWTWCFTEHGDSVAIRIDPRTLAARGSVAVGGPIAGAVVVVDELSWFILDRGIAAVDDRNEVVRAIDLGAGFAANNAVIAADALWVPDEEGRRVVRIELSALR
ncbi:MAG TPA: hypothetical protein VFR14_01130 [Candidatus Limnocylindrales bacterium]|nr:hypothetical protein [Candidatus Limnocylindrales bacterium]